jgi:hypothetical protein
MMHFSAFVAAIAQIYEVMIYPDAEGSSKVMDCSMLEAVTHVKCFEKFPSQ